MSTSSAPAFPPARRWQDWVGLLCRLVLGGLLLLSGVRKAISFNGSVQAVKNFLLFPDWISEILGYGLPVVEIILGVMLVVGLLTRAAGAASALMMLAFALGIASLWARGLKVDCGCFGGGGIDDTITWRTYAWEIARDLAMMLLGLWLAIRPKTPFAADNSLFRDITIPDTTDDED